MRNFEIYCKDIENVENYQKAVADNFKCWECHHRLETHLPNGKRRDVNISRKELIALRMYYNRPAYELIFLTRSEHNKLHHKGKNHHYYKKPMSEEQRKKISNAMKGEKNPFYGKHHSEETRKQISEAQKGKPKPRSNEAIKKTAEANRGKHWYNNGKENRFCFECPNGFVPGKLRI